MTDDRTPHSAALDSAALDVADPPARSQEPADVARRLEAILLVVDEPQSLVALAAAVAAPVPAVRQAIEGLVADYDGEAGGPRRGFELREVGGGWRLYVREELDDLVSEFVSGQAPSRLSQAALETLAVIAYRQPVTRSDVERVRGVRCDYAVTQLVKLGLIVEVGRKDVVGHPTLFGTTDKFLRQFGIHSVDEMPNFMRYSQEIFEEITDEIPVV